jgi:hypothetical protein
MGVLTEQKMAGRDLEPEPAQEGRKDATTPAPSSSRSRSAPRSGNGNDRSRNDGERPGTDGELFEPLAAFLERAAKLPPPSWLLEDLVPDAGRIFIVAAPNAGKTFLAMVIGNTAAKAGRPVFMVLEEGGVRTTADRLRNLGVDRTATAPVHLAHLRGVALADAGVRKRLTTVLREYPEPIMVLDPFSSLFRGDENSTREMNEAKAHLEELACINPRALLVLCHHTSKSGERGEGGPGMYAARGSSILSGWADVQLNLKHEPVPKGSGRISFVATVEKHRDGERGYKCRVTVPLGGGEVTFAEVKEQASTDERAARILEVAKETPGLSRDALAKAAGRRKTIMLGVIDQLAREGALVKRGTGYVVNDLPTDPEETTP